MGIVDFIADRMTAYINGGMEPEASANAARGELLAIYKGEHYSRDADGVLQITPLPESVDIGTAAKITDALIKAFLSSKTKKETVKPPAFDYLKESVEFIDSMFDGYRAYYDAKRKEHERRIAKLPQMEITVPEEIDEKIVKALTMQTYKTAKSADGPHQYCLLKNWRGETSLYDVVNLINEYGEVTWAWRCPYMTYYIGEFKYWTLGYPIEVETLINRTLIRQCTREELLKYS